MAINSFSKIFLSMSIAFVFSGVLANAQGLKLGFYKKTCPQSEAIILAEMKKIMAVSPSLAGALLRLHFHDCFVNVCHRRS